MSIFSQRSRSSKRPACAGRGFTLIELLVVMSIMVILTTVLLFRQAKFDSSTLLRSLGYSVALSVRQAQVYGTSVFGTTTTQAVCGTNTYQSGACFAPGYGIYLSAGSPGQYILFADLNNNGAYDAGEDVKVFTLSNGYVISDFCAKHAVGSSVDCWKGGTPVAGVLGSSGTLSITFRRPNPEACFTTNANSSCGVGASAFYATSSIQVQSTADSASSRSVFINSTGLISVGNAGT